MTNLPDIIVLDLEFAHSPDECMHCFQLVGGHMADGWCRSGAGQTRFAKIGWANKALCGLAIGCLWSYAKNRLLWFDAMTLEGCVRWLVRTRPYLVSFNGLTCDFPLMRAVLHQRASVLAQVLATEQTAAQLEALCATFKAQVEPSYDLLAAIWRADPGSRKVSGLNTLDSLCKANGIPSTPVSGALIPGLWQQGHIARVLNHCADDVLHTKMLFEQVMLTGEVRRDDGSTVLVHRTAHLLETWYGWQQVQDEGRAHAATS